jgi:hypothetical protein
MQKSWEGVKIADMNLIFDGSNDGMVRGSEQI